MSARRLFFCMVGLLIIGCVSRPFGAAAEITASLSDAPPLRSAASPGTDDRREAATVYCLSRPGRMVTALLALGLPVPGAAPAPAPTASPAPRTPSGASPRPAAAARTPGPAELQAWAVHNRKDFDRACDALIGAQTVSGEKKKPSVWVSAAKVFGPLLLGALLTLFTTEWRASVDRGRKEGLELRRLGRTFLTAASEYAEGRGDAKQPSGQPVHDAARELALRLEEIKARRPWWRTLSPVLAALDPERPGAAVTDGWQGLTEQGRKTRRAAVMEVVHRVDTQVGSTARALEHPWRPPVLRWFVFWQKVPS
ncbi:hypothetical protein AB0C87_13260 [Actinomadura sp. NPDC048021]|uniref:hypothetical protein n=1 Tax=Actinomadura sp. NPDC048021 TaxID=3155385 RepID=UPI0033DC4358